MGFWSSVGSCISSVGSFVSSCATGIMNTVGSVCSGAINSILTAVKGVGAFIDIIAKLDLGPLGMIVGAVVKICNLLGLIEDEDPEELGEKVLQAEEEGLTPESCENYKEYMDKINNFELDPEKSMEYELVDKLAAAGVYCEGVLVHKFGFGIAKLVPIIIEDSSFQNPEKLASLIENCEKNNFTLDDMADYLNGDLTGKQETAVESVYNLTNFE